MTITIYHNPACGTSRNVLGLIRNSGEEPVVIEYLKTPPSRGELVSLIGRMGVQVRDVLRRKGTPYDVLGLDDPALSDDRLIDAMMAHPILINRPIVVTPNGVKLCRPSETVLDILPESAARRLRQGRWRSPHRRCRPPHRLTPPLKSKDTQMLALAIFLITLVFVIWQPRGLGIGWSAMGGAVIALLTGVIHWPDVPVVWHIVWDATFTFVALIIISLLLDEAGFFQWAALHVARWGNGNGRRLFPLIVLLGGVIAAFFANDGAALFLTPIVVAILLRLDFPPAETLAFVVATGFVADSTSLPLVISNLVNIVSANYFPFHLIAMPWAWFRSIWPRWPRRSRCFGCILAGRSRRVSRRRA